MNAKKRDMTTKSVNLQLLHNPYTPILMAGTK